MFKESVDNKKELRTEIVDAVKRASDDEKHFKMTSTLSPINKSKYCSLLEAIESCESLLSCVESVRNDYQDVILNTECLKFIDETRKFKNKLIIEAYEQNYLDWVD